MELREQIQSVMERAVEECLVAGVNFLDAWKRARIGSFRIYDPSMLFVGRRLSQLGTPLKLNDLRPERRINSGLATIVESSNSKGANSRMFYQAWRRRILLLIRVVA